MRRSFNGTQSRHWENAADAAQAYFVIIYSLTGSISFAGFSWLYIRSDESPFLGYAGLAAAIGFTVSSCTLWFTQRMKMAKLMLVIITFVFLVLMLINGGIENTGLFWYFVFPVIAFFVMGLRLGTIWVVALAAVSAFLWLLPDTVVSLPHNYAMVRQLLISYLVVSAGVFMYQLNRDTVQRREKAVDQAKNEFLTLASHQLRTPISAVNWFSEMLLSGDTGKLSSEQKEHIQHIYHSNQRLAAVVDAMLIVSDLELKRLEIRNEPVDVSAISHEVLTDQMARYPEKPLQITEQYEEHVPKLRLDVRLIKLILRNLFSNAIKYTPKGGEIVVNAQRSDEKLTAKSRGSLLISVRDTGYGITASQQPAVFSKLFRAENIKSFDTDGTGLGLYIVKEVLENVGGRIWFESQEGEGSTFYVLLPLEGMKRRKSTKG